MEQERGHPIDRFDPLLRDMARWGLVEHDPSATDDGWRLSPDAQRRLSELVNLTDVVTAEDLVYLDHACAGCRQHGLTRLRQGKYLCESCAARLVDQKAAGGAQPRSSKRGRLRRGPGESSKPLAG